MNTTYIKQWRRKYLSRHDKLRVIERYTNMCWTKFNDLATVRIHLDWAIENF